jgi:hypothetical protein
MSYTDAWAEWCKENPGWEEWVERQKSLGIDSSTTR